MLYPPHEDGLSWFVSHINLSVGHKFLCWFISIVKMDRNKNIIFYIYSFNFILGGWWTNGWIIMTPLPWKVCCRCTFLYPHMAIRLNNIYLTLIIDTKWIFEIVTNFFFKKILPTLELFIISIGDKGSGDILNLNLFREVNRNDLYQSFNQLLKCSWMWHFNNPYLSIGKFEFIIFWVHSQ